MPRAGRDSAGEFMMGSTEAEKERPQHRVQIAYPLAVGRYPVTFEEYDHFARIAGREPPRDEGWGRGRGQRLTSPGMMLGPTWSGSPAQRPAVSTALGSGVGTRLPGRNRDAILLGRRHHALNANFGKSLRKTTEIGSYPANPFGLYDMQGMCGNGWRIAGTKTTMEPRTTGRPD